jgi:hypothetical protein
MVLSKNTFFPLLIVEKKLQGIIYVNKMLFVLPAAAVITRQR